MAGTYATVLSGHELQGGQFWQIVWHWLLSETGDHGAYLWARALINAVWDAISAALQFLIPENVQIDNITAKKVSGTGGPTAIRGITGNGAASAMDGGTLAEGARIAWFMVDEDHVGGTIIPGIPADSFTDQFWTVAYSDLVEDFADAITEELTLAGGAGEANFMVANRDDLTEPQIVFAGELRQRPAVIGRRTKR